MHTNSTFLGHNGSGAKMTVDMHSMMSFVQIHFCDGFLLL